MIAGFFTLACASSEAEIQAEFDAFVADRDGCEVDTDCAMATAGCPLGCFVYVNQAKVAEVEAKADELIEDYESWGASCEYDCVEALGPVCEDKHCVSK